jgi:hypothetical protein
MFKLSRVSIIKAGITAVTALLTACSGSPDGADFPGNALHVSCLQRPDTGSCRAAKPAYYYDYASDSCRQFLWGGCGVNVPFRSMDDCVNACGGRPQR